MRGGGTSRRRRRRAHEVDKHGGVVRQRARGRLQVESQRREGGPVRVGMRRAQPAVGEGEHGAIATQQQLGRLLRRHKRVGRQLLAAAHDHRLAAAEAASRRVRQQPGDAHEANAAVAQPLGEPLIDLLVGESHHARRVERRERAPCRAHVEADRGHAGQHAADERDEHQTLERALRPHRHRRQLHEDRVGAAEHEHRRVDEEERRRERILRAQGVRPHAPLQPPHEADDREHRRHAAVASRVARARVVHAAQP